jgi:hypothetical protein
MSYVNGLVTVTTAPTPICSVGERGGIVVQNNSAAAVFLGGPNVAVSGVNTGISLAAGATIFIPSVGSNLKTLYGVVVTATAAVAFLFPSDGSS